MGIFDEIQRFIDSHKTCGKVRGKIQEPTAEGYAVSVSCACGESLDRFVTPESARHDLIYSTLLCSPN